MGMRSNTRDAAQRATLSAVYATIDSVDDTNPVQNVTYRGLYNEKIEETVRHQTYGHTSVPMAPDQNGAAEGVVIYPGGNRSDGILISTDDRRYRPKNLKAGDSSHYHHSGSASTFTDAGLTIDMGTQKKPVTIKTGKTTHTYADGNNTIVVGNATWTIKDGTITMDVNGTQVTVTDGQVVAKAAKICLGSSGASIPVMLQSGPSSKVFADG